MVYDISKPAKPRALTQVVCPGSQNDVSVYRRPAGPLAPTRAAATTPAPARHSGARVKTSWEGLKVFDISDPANPQYVSAVETPCGSHTHSLAPDKSGKNLYVYVSSYFPNATFPDCQPPHDQISVVKIPTDSPRDAAARRDSGAVPRRRQPSRQLLAGDQRLPRHHRLPGEGRRCGRLHG